MLIENDAHPDKPQQDEPHQQAGHHTGKIDPDIGDLAAAARHKELDGLIGQGCEQAAQHGPGHMLEEMPGVHPQAEHEQEAFQQILAEMRQLAHDVHGEPVGGIWGFPPVPAFESRDLPTGPQVFGGMACTVLDTPGHTPGGVSYYFPDEKAVFTGDALFYRSLGRTDFPGSSQEALRKSLHKKIFILPQETAVYPGHGPNTNVGEELANNPYLWL